VDSSPTKTHLSKAFVLLFYYYLMNTRKLKKRNVPRLVNSRFRSTLRTRVVKPELKYLDNVLSVAPGSSGAIFGCNSIAEGNEFNQRVGRSILPVAVEYDIALLPPQNSGTTDCGIIEIIWDKQGNGAAPALTDLFDTSVVNAAFGFLNISKYRDRFVVLKTFPVGYYDCAAYATSGNAYPMPQQIGSFPCRWRGRVSLKRFKTSFLASGGTIPATGSIYLVAVGSNASTSTTLSFSIYGGVRFFFEDA